MDTGKKRTKPESADKSSEVVSDSKRSKKDANNREDSTAVSASTSKEQQDSFFSTEDNESSLSSESKPIDYFDKFIDTKLLTLMVRGTNKYAELITKSSGMSQGSRMKQWKPVTISEMKAFIGVLLEMGVTRRPSIFSYWAENSRSIPWFSKMFSRNRFQLIFQCFYLVESECFPPGHENYDPCVEFLPMVEHANKVFRLYYKPHKELFISESLIGTSGVMSSKKHNQYGIKFWTLCDAVSKYCLGFYCYKSAKGSTDGTTSQHGLGYDIVINLLNQSQCLNKGHHLFVNSYFSSVALAKYLHSKNTYLTGAIKSNNKDIPNDIKTPKINEAKYARDGDVLLCGYRENKSVKKPILLISTYASDNNITEIKKRNGHEIRKIKPCIVDCYNRYIGGVDECDKMLYVYLDERRTVRYWKKVTFNIITRMVLNSYLYYKEVTKNKLMTVWEFTSSIISDIEQEWMQVKKEQTMSTDGRTVGLMKLPGRNLRQCVVCSSRSTGIKRSNLICVQCKKGLHPLCIHKHVCFKNNKP